MRGFETGFVTLSVGNLKEMRAFNYTAQVKWRGGISPPRSHGTVREPLDSYGSYRPATLVGTKWLCFTQKTPPITGWSSNKAGLLKRLLPLLVGPPIKLDNAAPSLQSHYRTFITTTGYSAPVPCLGTLTLMGPPLEFLP